MKIDKKNSLKQDKTVILSLFIAKFSYFYLKFLIMKKSFALFFIFILSLFYSQNFISYVNPLVGTKNMGHTFPGAAAPFGMYNYHQKPIRFLMQKTENTILKLINIVLVINTKTKQFSGFLIPILAVLGILI